MTDRELMQQALDCLLAWEEESSGYGWSISDQECVEALRARLAQPEEKIKCQHKFEVDEDAPLHSCCQICGEVRKQPEQEPVAWWHDMGDVVDLNVSGHGIPLYPAPPQRECICKHCGESNVY